MPCRLWTRVLTKSLYTGFCTMRFRKSVTTIIWYVKRTSRWAVRKKGCTRQTLLLEMRDHRIVELDERKLKLADDRFRPFRDRR